MSTLLFIVLVVISFLLLTNAVALFRAIFKLDGPEAFDWWMGFLLTALWVVIFFLVRN